MNYSLGKSYNIFIAFLHFSLKECSFFKKLEVINPIRAIFILMNEFLGFYIVITIVACMAWIWRKLKDIETHLKERDLVQEKHNKDIAAYLSSISQEAINQEWERKSKAEQEIKKEHKE
ncbi:hypothetical protein N9W64_00600 [Gammaproteobacteria bacterium]|nr:hypothetical protein [Gammaproteobacteria bacterium]